MAELAPDERERVTQVLSRASVAAPPKLDRAAKDKFGLTGYKAGGWRPCATRAAGPSSHASLPSLADLPDELEADDPKVRARGIRKLRAAGVQGAPMLPWEAAGALAGLVQDDSEKVRAAAVRTLEPMGAVAMGHLARRLADGDVQVRRAASKAILQLGPAASPHAAAIGRRLVRERAPDVRRTAAMSLGQLGVSGARQTLALGVALEDQSADVRHAAQRACNAILRPREGPRCDSWRGEQRGKVDRSRMKQAQAEAIQRLEEASERCHAVWQLR
uniref:HEAT repeat domain-containing protein n=1 Tax=Zooxanthella nutricula TaxID=1333877 RepID=A0A7S2ML11_9DINO